MVPGLGLLISREAVEYRLSPSTPSRLRELTKYIVDAVRDSITRDPNNKLMEFVQWAGEGYEKPFYSQFLHMKPIETPLNAVLEPGSNPRSLKGSR